MDNLNQLAKIPRVRQRRAKVMELLLSGWSRSQILLEQKQEWGAGNKTTDKDIEHAYATIRLNHNTEYSELISRHISSYYELYNKAEELGDVKGAIQSLQAIEKLLKMHNPDNPVFIQNNNLNVEQLDEHQIRALLDEYNEDK